MVLQKGLPLSTPENESVLLDSAEELITPRHQMSFVGVCCSFREQCYSRFFFLALLTDVMESNFSIPRKECERARLLLGVFSLLLVLGKSVMF